MDKRTTTKRRVISNLNLPSKIPLNLTLIAVIWYRLWPPVSTLEKVVWGVVIGIIVLLWTGAIYNLGKEEQEDIFERHTIVNKEMRVPTRQDLYSDIIEKYKDKLDG